ncbi:MAG: PucR family transcriptional regulator [Aggregatilineales bacterium]
MTPAHSLTVQDVLRLTLPIGTRIVAGREGLNRPVAWPSVLQTRPPAFPDLEGRELALLSLDALHLVSDKLTLADLVAELADADVAGIGVIGAIDDRAADIADIHAIPLLNLPINAVLRQIERDVVRALADPNAPVEQRGQQIHEQLLQLFTENRGMAALAGAIADATGKTVIVQDKRLDTLVAVGSIRDSAQWPALERELAREDLLPAIFRDRAEVAKQAPAPTVIDLPEYGIQRLIAPIVANRLGRGFFSLLSEFGTFDTLDSQFTRHGVAVCALEMAKAKAVREAQKRVQGGVLERLLNGTIAPDEALRQLMRMGRQPQDRPYSALVAAWIGGGSPSGRRLETMFNEQVSAHNLDALVQLLETGVVIFCHAEGDERALRKAAPRAVRQLAETIQERAHIQFPDTGLAIGIGRPVQTLENWRSGYQEALAAQRMATQWRIGTPLFFGDLGVYRLLSLLLESAELRSFYRETLGDLVSERYVHDEFIKTLEAFFEEDGNLSQTAKKLNIHRNTLLYRMDRIAQIGSFDLTNPETRLAVHLALKIRRLLSDSS